MTVVCISDTHHSRPPIPEGNVLIHAGDLSQHGTLQELQAQLDWLNSQPHQHKIVIAGNHDLLLDAAYNTDGHERQTVNWGSISYLEDTATTLTLADSTLSIFGSPHTRRHGNWAFQYSKEADVFTGCVPQHTAILVTHSPPRFHLDIAGWGDRYLLQELWRVRPSLHVFGHAHEGAGQEILVYDRFQLLYERVRAGQSSLFGLIAMAGMLLLMILGVSFSEGGRTILIIASMVGGLLDKNPRKAQVVYL